MVTSEEFIEKFEKIPPKLQDLLASDKFPQEIEDILILTNTDLKYFEPIIDTIEEILLLEKSKDSLEKSLQEKTDLPLQKIQIISDLIRKRIFTLVEEELNLFSSPMNFLENLPGKEEVSQKKPIEEIITQEPIIESQKNTPPVSSVFIPQSYKEAQETTTSEKTLEKPQEELKEELPSKKLTPQPKEKIELEEKIEFQKIPEPQQVIVEKPVDKTKELKRIKIPTISEEEQRKIREKLLKIMTEKKTTASPKILEEMKKISETGIKPENLQERTQKTISKGYSYFEEKKEPVSFSFEESEKFIPEEEKEVEKEKTTEIPPIIGAKIQEFKKKKI